MSEFEHIIEIPERMEKKQNEFFSEVRAMVNSGPGKWVDSLEVQRIFGISRRTLYRVLADKILSCKHIGDHFYYFTPGIFKIKDHFFLK